MTATRYYGGPLPEIEPTPGLDPLIAPYVHALQAIGIETYESCQSGPGHCYPEASIRFHGGVTELYRAYAHARYYNWRVSEMSRLWDVIDGELSGPHCQLTLALYPYSDAGVLDYENPHPFPGG